MVEDVESIHAELQILFSNRAEVLEQRHVGAPIARTCDDVLLGSEEFEHRRLIGDGSGILTGHATDDRADRASHRADEIARERICECAGIVPVCDVPERAGRVVEQFEPEPPGVNGSAILIAFALPPAAVASWLLTLNGVPVCAANVALDDHPPATTSSTRELFRKVRPRPNGS